MGSFLRLVAGVPKMIGESSSVPIYDDTYVAVAPVLTGTAITLPGGQTYQGKELEVELNGQEMTYPFDYNYVGGSGPKTQIALTFDLRIGDRVGLRITRNL